MSGEFLAAAGFAAMFIAIVTVIVVLAVRQGLMIRDLRQRGIDVPATVTTITTRRDLDDDVMLSRRYIHSYQAEGSHPQTGAALVFKGTFRSGSQRQDRIQEGDRVLVRMDPRDPRRYHVPGL